MSAPSNSLDGRSVGLKIDREGSDKPARERDVCHGILKEEFDGAKYLYKRRYYYTVADVATASFLTIRR